MKKIGLLLFLLCLCGCGQNVDLYEEIKKDSLDDYQEEKIIYEDTNPIKPSIYVDSPSGGYAILADTYQSKWVKKKDIIVLLALYTNDDYIKAGYFQDTFYNYAKQISSYENYKIGWEISFVLKDGTNIRKTILRPKDVTSFYDYLEIYLYDSANIAKDTWYSHLLDEEFNENTLLTTMKLTAGSLYEEISSDIDVKLFTYDGDDFDETNFYKGSSYDNLKLVNE